MRPTAAPIRMPSVPRAVAALAVLALAGGAATASAQGTPIRYSASVSGLYNFKSDLDNSGGSFSWGSVIVNGSIDTQINPQWSLGFTAGYQYENWSFDNPAAFGGQAPWGDVNRPSVAATITYRPSADIGLFATPSIEWAYERGAQANAQIYGAVMGATKVFSPSLVLGLGAGVYRQITENKVFPFLIVNWQIDDKWKLGNPFRAGPAGGAGLELSYAISDDWEAAGGGTWRDYRFRLQPNGTFANDIGENQGIPLFARLTRKIGKDGRFDVYAGAIVDGKLKLRDPNGNQIVSSDYNVAPFLALTLASSF